jgi:hypothetical protein
MKHFFSALVIIATFISCSGDKDKKLDAASYKKEKNSLLERERNSPKEFLTLTGNDKRRWLFGTTVYKGTIHNSATVCSYKNVRVKLLYYKKDGSLVTNHEELFEDAIEPNSDFDFKTKYHTPKGTDSVSAYIMSAEAVKQ